jgi:hypothetical protein
VTTDQPSTAARLRGVAVGLLTAALAVAAHGAAGSGVPVGAAVVLLGVLAATIGGLALTIPRSADVGVLLGLLAVGQVVGHVMLSAAGHSHGASVTASPAMVLAHAIAVLTGAVLIAACDRLCRAMSRAIAAAVRAVAAPISSGPTVVVAGTDQPLRSALLLAASVSHRGPPVGRAV